MKKVILSALAVAALGFTSCKTEPKPVEDTNDVVVTKAVDYTHTTINVNGNCDMCKTKIESTVKGLDGVESAEWNAETKKLDISYNNRELNMDKIHKAVAEAGYDTDMMKADDEAYNKLPECCKYDRNIDMN